MKAHLVMKDALQSGLREESWRDGTTATVDTSGRLAIRPERHGDLSEPSLGMAVLTDPSLIDSTTQECRRSCVASGFAPSLSITVCRMSLSIETWVCQSSREYEYNARSFD